MFKVYAETSFFSACATIRTDPIDIGRRMTSERWWSNYSRHFELHISREVVRELSDVRFPASVRDPALAMLVALPALELDSDVVALAKVLVDQRVMPSPAVQGDALHVAASITEWITS